MSGKRRSAQIFEGLLGPVGRKVTQPLHAQDRGEHFHVREIKRVRITMHTQGLGHGRACFRALQQPIGERAPVEDDQMASRSLRSRRMISDAGSPSAGALVATRSSISSSVGRAASWSSSPRRYSPSKRSTRVSDPSLSDSDAMAREPLDSGLHEAVLTKRLARRLVELDRATLDLDVGSLSDAEASDRLSRHVARLVGAAIDAFPERERAEAGGRLVAAIFATLDDLAPADLNVPDEVLEEPARVLLALLRRRPDGTAQTLGRPLTPLSDTTVLTNAPGEPRVGHELRAEVDSASAIDVVVAFVRFSGVRPMLEVLKRHVASRKPVRVLTTTYTNSTEKRALDALAELGADIRVSYDTSLTRLHAKAWIFHRGGRYSTAYLGSSNLTYSGQEMGLEWNVRLSEVRNPDAVAKMVAVFSAYWESPDFVPYDPDEFARRTELRGTTDTPFLLSPVEVELRPFQEALLERLALARTLGHDRNLLVSATGTGKTVMAAVDYHRLRKSLPRDRLLFIAHREEILDQSRATFRHALREPTFGERWVAGERPARFDHVFASVQSLARTDLSALDPGHFDVVIVDEFHHAAALSYEKLLEHLDPCELVGLTATPERGDGLDILKHFDGRIAAELRLWDAIDQQHLSLDPPISF